MISEDDLLSEKLALVEDLAVHFECNDNLPPLASKIVIYLILSGIEGATFDELVEKLEASKSSVSTSLNLLQSLERITYSTKLGDRKRYFKISPNHLIRRLDEKIIEWEKEKNIHLKIYNFKQKMMKAKNIPIENNFSLKFGEQHMEFVDKMINNFQELKKNLLTIINKTY